MLNYICLPNRKDTWWEIIVVMRFKTYRNICADTGAADAFTYLQPLVNLNTSKGDNSSHEDCLFCLTGGFP